MTGSEKKLNKLNKSVEYLLSKTINILDTLAVPHLSAATLRQLINLIPTKKIYPQKLKNTLYGQSVVALQVDDVLITGGAQNTDIVTVDNYIYNVAKNTYTSKQSLDVATQGHTACKVSSEEILLSGGLNGGLTGDRITRNVIYNINNNTYTNKADLPSARERHTAHAINRSVYLLGGITGSGWGQSAAHHKCYDLNTNAFTDKGSYGDNIAGHAILGLEIDMYYFGGQTNEYSQTTNTVKRYIVDNNTFETKRNLAESKACLSSIKLLNNNVILSGGYLINYTKSNKNELYSINTNTYTTKTQLDKARSNHKAVYLGSGGALIGGKLSDETNETKGTPTNIVEYYNYYNNEFYKGG